MESEKKPELRPPFIFKDKFGSYEISRELKNLCDNLEHANPHIKELIDSYLINLIHIAYIQKDEYKKRGKTYEETPSQITMENRQSEMDLFIHRRNKVIQKGGSEAIARLELYLSIDSRGLEAGDARPFLGANMEIIKNLAHYLHKETGYGEIITEN
jgi:hypothetical protein